tara:strand:- start:1192 stop:1473 length:282 start_codon:yes stop_codon:yes gene_type:complete
MAITKETVVAKIEAVGEYRHVQIAEDIVIKEDGTEISKTRHRRVLQCCTLDNDKNKVDTDVSSESSEIQGICNTVWTDEIKTAYANKLKSEIE